MDYDDGDKCSLRGTQQKENDPTLRGWRTLGSSFEGSQSFNKAKLSWVELRSISVIVEVAMLAAL